MEEMPDRTAALRDELALAQTLVSQGRFDEAFHHLERAHILGQLGFIGHVRVHLRMLGLAIRRADRPEIAGQILRLLATVPGHLFGWIPIGNTGGSNVSALRPMPPPDDLLPYLKSFSLKHQVVRQGVILVGLAAVVAAVRRAF